MSDDPQGTAAVSTGQATTDPAPAATTGAAPTSSSGQPAGQQTTTQQGTDADDAFFDPKDLDPSLMPAYKNMQKAFSKKMETIKASRQKIEAYDELSSNPAQYIQRMAEQMGFQLTPKQAAAAAQAAKDWQPQTWEDVLQKATETAEQRLMEKFQPLIHEVTSMKKNSIEKLLDDSCPDWRQHEDDMMANLKKHPSLVNDPAALYRMSVPPDVLESRATQNALKKLQAKATASQVSGTSTTTKQQSQIPSGPMTFSQAVEAAKKKLAADGIRPS